MNILILASLFALLFLGVADNQATLVLLPAIGETFAAGIISRGFLITVYSVGAAAASLATGFLSDHYGRKRFLQWAVVGFGIFSFLTSQAGSLNLLLATRFATGVAAGTLSTCSVALAGDWFPYQVRGRAVGIISSAYFAAPILGVPLAAQSAERFGWHTTYLFFAAGAIVCRLLTFGLPPDTTPSPRSTFSELRQSAGRTLRELFGRADTSALMGIAFLVSGALVGFLTYLIQWLKDGLGLTTSTIGWVWMLGGLAAFVGAPLGGILSDRWGKKRVALGSNILLAFALLAVPWTRWGTVLLILFGLISFAAAFRQSPTTALVTQMVGSGQRGAMVALRNVSSQLGIAAATFGGGFLYEQWNFAAVALFCSLLTAGVVFLLAWKISEPGAGGPEVKAGAQPATRV